MAPIPFKSIVSVSSEDSLNPAKNLLQPNSSKKWICTLDNKPRTAEVVIELCKRAKITSLEIANFGSAFVEVSVANSSASSSDKDDFIILLPSSMLMSVPESRGGRNKTKTVIYKKERLSAIAVGKKWNRVKIKCVQKYNQTSQFGLLHVAVFSDVPATPLSSNIHNNASLFTPPHTPQHPSTPHSRHSTPNRQTTPNVSSSSHHREHRLPSLSNTTPSLKTPGGANGGCKSTPKRPLKDHNSRGEQEKGEEEEDFEFSGLERQSRLFQNCMRGKSSTDSGSKESNPILERISSDKEKYRTSFSGYQKKKLLKRELVKADPVMQDFVKSYQADGATKGVSAKDKLEMSSAWSRMSAFDNDYEIGEEPEETWGWHRFIGKPKSSGRKNKRSRGGSCDGWLSKKKKLDNMIQECSSILNKASEGEADGTINGGGGDRREANESTCSKEANKQDEVCCSAEGDSDAETVVYDLDDEVVAISNQVHTASTDSCSNAMIECPMCSRSFPSYAIELHAASCTGGEPEYSVAAGLLVDTNSTNVDWAPIVID